MLGFRKILTTAMALAVLVTTGATSVVSGAARTETPEKLTNIAHLDFLGDTVDPPERAGHTTYRLAEEPQLRVLWTYAEPDGTGNYVRIGGGTYNLETNTYGQGAYNTDDLTRAAVVYIRHWRQFGDEHSKQAAYGLLRTVAYMQTISNDERNGNFVLWMQPDGTLNPSAEPVELPDPSDSGPSYWLARGIWAYGEGYAAFKDVDPVFAAFLRDRMELAVDALERQVLADYGQTQMVDGLALPAWLIADGADASAEAVLGLSAYVNSGGGAAARAGLEQLADGIAQMQIERRLQFPFGAVLPWAQSRSVWHGWGDQMSGSLALAGTVLHDAGLISNAVDEAGTFTPHLLAQGGSDQGWLPAPAELAQIAYGADSTLQNLLRTAEATRRTSFRQLAGVAGAWYFGNNPAGAQMYDSATGRTFDGINSDRSINRNSGAESTIHGLLSMLALDANPDVRELALRAQRRDHATWTLVEAESGRLSGDAHVVQPESAWTGESLWTGGRYVSLGPGGRVKVDVQLPVRDRYRLLPVFHRLEAPAESLGTRHRIANADFGIAWHTGAGDQGITPMPGFLDTGHLSARNVLKAGRAKTTTTYTGDGRRASLDSLLVQPEIEHLVLGGDGGGQALLRSWSEERRSRTLEFGDPVVFTAYSYDQRGLLAETTAGAGDSAAVPVQPGGFTYVLTR